MIHLALRNLLVRVGADISDLAKGLKDANKKVEKFSQRISDAMGGIGGKISGALAGLGAGILIKDAVGDAVRYEALMTTLGETVGESIEVFKEWQDTIGSAMGFSKLQGAELANMLSLNFKSISTSAEDLVTRTTKMMELAAVISNKRGMAMSEVSDRIRSAMNQEADGAMELGVDVRIAAIKAGRAYQEMADGAPWDKLSEQMRKTILYHHIFDQVSQNLGMTLADNTQIRVAAFTASLADVRLALGSAFLPILNVVLPLLTAFMRKLQQALHYVYSFVTALFGTPKKASGIKSQISTMDKATDSAVKFGDAQADAGKATSKAGKAAKKAAKDMQDNLQSFDEFHQLAKEPSAGAGAGGGGGGGGGGGIGGGGGALEGLGGFEKPLAFTDGIFGELNKKAKKFGETVRNWAKDSDGLESLKTGLKDFWGALDDFWNSPAIKNFRQNFKEDLPNFFSDIALIGGGTFKSLGGAVDLLTALINGDHKKAFEGLGDTFAGLWDIFSGTVGLIFPDLGNALSAWGKSFGEKWDWFLEKFVNNSDSAKEVWDKFCKFMDEKAREKVEEVKKYFVDLYKKWNQNAEDWKRQQLQKFEEWKNGAKEKISAIPIWFKEKFGELHSWFKTNVSDPIKKSFENIASAFDISFSAGLKTVYNEAVGWINKAISAINEIDFIPFTIPTLKTLRLAEGGITNGPTFAMIGDNPGGKEVVSPLDKLQGFVTNAVIEAMALNGGAASGDVVLNIDGRQFARLVKPHLDKESQRIGTNVRLSLT